MVYPNKPPASRLTNFELGPATEVPPVLSLALQTGITLPVSHRNGLYGWSKLPLLSLWVPAVVYPSDQWNSCRPPPSSRKSHRNIPSWEISSTIPLIGLAPGPCSDTCSPGVRPSHPVSHASSPREAGDASSNVSFPPPVSRESTVRLDSWRSGLASVACFVAPKDLGQRPLIRIVLPKFATFATASPTELPGQGDE
jgi:hypothetical protein